MEPLGSKMEQLNPVSKDPLVPTYTYIGLDNAKVLHRALTCMPEYLRLEWLNWCCKVASEGEPLEFRVVSVPGSVKEYLINLYQMVNHGRLTMELSVQCAEDMARQLAELRKR